MKRAILALVVLLLELVQVIGCSGTTVITTQTEFQTITGPASTTTATVNVTGGATTVVVATTIPGPTITTTQVNTAFITTTATVTGPTTTLTTTKTAMITQGFTYVSATSPASPATLHLNDWVTVTLDYVITDPGGARM